MAKTRSELEKALKEEEQRLEAARVEFRDGNGSRGAELYMFKTNLHSHIQSLESIIKELEDALSDLNREGRMKPT